MNAELLLAHFNRISDAPDAVPRLRRFILDLAVRGKLIEQDPRDESVCELLGQLHTQKAILISKGKIRTQKPTGNSVDNEQPFSIPKSWIWCHLSDVGAIIGGGTPPSGDSENFAPGGTEIAWITPADLGKHTSLYVSHGARDLTNQGLRSSSVTVMPKGSVLFTSRAPIGYTAIAANEVSTNQGFKSVLPFIMDCNLYIAIYFRAFAQWIDGKASGTTFREVSGKIVASLPFPLPPLAEQHRIVAKVDELMALCDKLEAAQRDRESCRDRLTGASHHHLNNGADAEAIRGHAQFFIGHIPRLTKRPDQIKQLRQTILNLAVHGKLVAPNSTDGDTSPQLLQNDKVRQVIAKTDRRADLHRQNLMASNLRWAVPATWQWVALADVVLFIDYRGKTPNKITNGVRLITAKNVKKGFIDLSPEEFLSESEYHAWMTRGLPSHGDILFTTEAPMGNAAVVNLTDRFALAQRVICFRPYGGAETKFITLQILSEPFQAILDEMATGLTAKGIKAAKLKHLPLAIPPLAEQYRIVAKVDELMALCDQLESSLNTAQTATSRLLESVLHHALEASA